MDQPTPVATPLRAPRAFHPAKVDGAGWLKFPVRYQEHLKALANTEGADKTLFITLMKGMARIYTNGAYERNLAKLDSDPALKQRIAYFADAYGAEVEIDPQWRVTLPQKMRQELQLEDQPVHLRMFEDVITIYPQPAYEAEMAKVKASHETDLERAAGLGFNL